MPFWLVSGRIVELLLYFIESKFGAAATKYTEAIELCPTAVFYSNRSLAMIKMESYGSAILDSNEALALDPSYIKAYYRSVTTGHSPLLLIFF
jgi:tetratricopeptide (TPR) repeat protein